MSVTKAFDLSKAIPIPGRRIRIFVDVEIADDETRPILYKKNRGVKFAALNPQKLAEIMADVRKDWRAASHKKYARSERGQTAKQIWNQSVEGKAAKLLWHKSDAGKAAKIAWRQSDAGKTAKLAWNQSPEGRAAKAAWYKTDVGQACKQREHAARRDKSLDRYLNRIIVGIDSEGRAPLHTIDSEGRTPLEVHKATGGLKHLTKDSSDHYWEPHELSLIGTATIHRPYGTPIGEAKWQDPIWFELKPKNQTEQCFDALLSLPERFPKKPNHPLYVMFSAAYDWSMWCQDIPFNKAFELARQRGFAPPCKLMRGMVFWKKYAIKIRPYFDFKLTELRWPDDPYGKNHMDDPLYEKPPKGSKFKLQRIRHIEIFDTYRLSPKTFVETIKPLVKRDYIPAEVFNTIKVQKEKRGAFHLESMETVKKYCRMELHSFSAFMHMIRDACWTSDEIRLKSFHSPAAIASVLLKRIDIRAHSWPVKSVNLDDEQIMAHGAYFGGRFEWIPKGYMREPGYQDDEANAYPYGMQFLPSMIGGHWERVTFKTNALTQPKLLKKMIEQSCILSMFRVRFYFDADASFYPLPYRQPNNVILYPYAGYGNYMRDDVLNAFDWCKEFKIPIERRVTIEEAYFFHPAPDTVFPFAPLKDIYKKRIEFDKTDPKGPEQSVLKGGMNSCYGKLAQRRFTGIDPKSRSEKFVNSDKAF